MNMTFFARLIGVEDEALGSFVAGLWVGYQLLRLWGIA